jgi:hypothetical protein
LEEEICVQDGVVGGGEEAEDAVVSSCEAEVFPLLKEEDLGKLSFEPGKGNAIVRCVIEADDLPVSLECAESSLQEEGLQGAANGRCGIVREETDGETHGMLEIFRIAETVSGSSLRERDPLVEREVLRAALGGNPRTLETLHPSRELPDRVPEHLPLPCEGAVGEAEDFLEHGPFGAGLFEASNVDDGGFDGWSWDECTRWDTVDETGRSEELDEDGKAASWG